MHEFYNFCRHTEWNLLSSLCKTHDKICQLSGVKLNSKLTQLHLCQSEAGIGQLVS